MEAPKHVILFTYDASTKQHERYDALVIGAREFDDHDEPVLNLVHFRHNDTASHHALNGVDWADTLERVLDVPHKDDLQQQSFYYLREGEENPAPSQPAEFPGSRRLSDRAPRPETAKEEKAREAAEEAERDAEDVQPE